MALVKTKPTSPGRRSMMKVVNAELHKGAPHAALLEPQFKQAGRNHHGHITTRHQGGGHKQHYRIIDFKRNDKDGIVAKVERLEYDPNRSANIALLCYVDGERRYIIAPKGIAAGAELVSGAEAPIKIGNTLPLRNIPVGSTIHCIEMLPGKGAQLARSAGPRYSYSRAKAYTHNCVCAPVKSVKCTSIAAPPSVKSATANTVCASSAKPVPIAGVAGVRRFAQSA